MIEWTEAGLRLAGFVGFRRFADLEQSPAPSGPGVYVILRTSTSTPRFLAANPSARRQGRDPSHPAELLAARWLPATPVIYIGKAGLGASGRRGLQKRLREFARHGMGKRWGHSGGEWIWQLADAADLVVAWMETPTEDPESVETALIDDFATTYGRLPFANRKRGRRRTA